MKPCGASSNHLAGLQLGLGVLPLVLRLDVLPLGRPLINGGRPAGAILVRLGLQLAPLNGVQQRREDGPGGTQLITPHKVLGVTPDAVQDEALVGIRDVEVLVALGVGQLQLAHLLVHVQARCLDHQLDVDGLTWLELDDQLVPHVLQVTKYRGGRCLELHTHRHQPLIERLARLDHDGHSRPALIVDVQPHSSVCGLLAASGDSGVVQVAGVAVTRHVLADDAVRRVHLPHTPQQLHLLITHVIGVHAHGGLHHQQRKHLQQVVLYHVPHDAVLVKVTASPLSAKRLLEADLHVGHVMPVPP
mmetsp:Transcript_20291/g.44314  ORF Transcript_20291/g.44314 Transcript_20291/m.44314 type:complete len:303 (+) Transcript_20291:1396-2304(+)